MSQATAEPVLQHSDKPATNSRRLWQRGVWVVVAVYWISMFAGTHWPSGPHLPISGGDKVMHFSAYLGLAFLLSLATVTWSPSLWLKSTAIVILLACYGAFDEITQPLFGRDCELFDWYADTVGVLMGVGLFFLAAWVLGRRRSGLAE